VALVHLSSESQVNFYRPWRLSSWSKPGNRVFVGTACATPTILVEALERREPIPPDVELFHFLTSGLEHLWFERLSRYRHRCFFVGSDVRALVHTGQADYVPISLTQIPHLMANGRSPPDAHGFVSLGISVDITSSVRRNDCRRS
jgi:acyl-CoA hydrolase